MEIKKTARFIQWYASLCDAKAKAAIARRIERAEGGNPGDVKPVGEGYRLYFTMRERTVVFLLCGGDKPKNLC
jgi:putative addiction module killer protein